MSLIFQACRCGQNCKVKPSSMHSEKYLFIEIDRSIISNVTSATSQSDLFEEGIVIEITVIDYPILSSAFMIKIYH